MTIHPPAPGEPRRPHGPRDPGDAWVIAPTGERYWGRFGAAGLLAVDAERGILLQHRVAWSHHGGTWGLPGGARHAGESAADAAIREAQEEAGVPDGALAPRLCSVFDLGFWSYATLAADVAVPFEPVISDPESVALEWVAVDAVDARELHPGFGAAWPRLRALLDTRPVVIVDAANVVGAVPDGWWKDRAGAASRLLARLAAWRHEGTDASALGLPEDRWYPGVTVVLEGQARAADAPEDPGPGGGGVEVVRAEASGDDEIVRQAERHVAAGADVTVVTSDRGLADRVTAAGARVHGAVWLLERLPGR